MDESYPKFNNEGEKAQYLKNLLIHRRKIQAIKFVRTFENLSLVDAKLKVEQAIEELEKLPIGHPDRPIDASQSMKGCLIPFIIIDMIIVAGIIIYFLNKQ